MRQPFFSKFISNIHFQYINSSFIPVILLWDKGAFGVPIGDMIWHCLSWCLLLHLPAVFLFLQRITKLFQPFNLRDAGIMDNDLDRTVFQPFQRTDDTLDPFGIEMVLVPLQSSPLPPVSLMENDLNIILFILNLFIKYDYDQ